LAAGRSEPLLGHLRVSAHPEREDRAIVNAKIGAS